VSKVNGKVHLLYEPGRVQHTLCKQESCESMFLFPTDIIPRSLLKMYLSKFVVMMYQSTSLMYDDIPFFLL
jgi:hypothetical protein